MSAAATPSHRNAPDAGTSGRSVTEVAGRRVTVMGLGRFGGGVGVTRWLALAGAKVTVTDRAEAEVLADSLAQIADLPVELALGGHPDDLLDRTDLLVVSPAVDKARSSFFRTATTRGVASSSEMNLFLERCPARVIGVTGSAGKSTTTAMIGEVLQAGLNGGPRRVYVGGNIGKSLLSELDAIRPQDVVVVELSSFQLENLAAIDAGPDVAVFTNLAPNHLDRHGTMAQYADAKLNLVRSLRPGGTVIHNLDDERLQRHLRPVLDGWSAAHHEVTVSARHAEATVLLKDAAIRVRASEPPAPVRGPAAENVRPQPGPAVAESLIVPVRELPLPGLHNTYNAMTAVAVGVTEGLPGEAIRTGLRRFRGLPHRLEPVAEIDGVRYYNDSKSTTPEAALVALAAFDNSVVMIVGGDDKKPSDFTELGRRLARRAKAVICMGKTHERIAHAVAACRGHGRHPDVRHAADLRDAVARARRQASPGDAVVLSPACASYDMFANYEKRGEAFRAAVRSLDAGLSGS